MLHSPAPGTASAPAVGFGPDGRGRVNANHKLLDAWLLVLCTVCGDTAKLT
ncbi:DUF1062 domain-containing protein, partial [Streptomyces goshikiensis]